MISTEDLTAGESAQMGQMALAAKQEYQQRISTPEGLAAANAEAAQQRADILNFKYGGRPNDSWFDNFLSSALDFTIDAIPAIYVAALTAGTGLGAFAGGDAAASSAAGSFGAASAVDAGLAESIATLAVPDLSSVAFLNTVSVGGAGAAAAAAGAGVVIAESSLPALTVPALDAFPVVSTSWGTGDLLTALGGVSIPESSLPGLTMPALDPMPAVSTSWGAGDLASAVAGIPYPESALPGITMPTLDPTAIAIGPEDFMPIGPPSSLGNPFDIIPRGVGSAGSTSLGDLLGGAKTVIGAGGAVAGAISGATRPPGSTVPVGTPAAGGSNTTALILGALALALFAH